MTLIKDLVQYLSDNTTKTVGTDLFLGIMPEDKLTGIVVSSLGGVENDTNMMRTVLQIMSYGNDYTSADTNCWEAYEALVYSNGITLTYGYVFNIIPYLTPQFIGRNEKDKFTFMANVAMFVERR